MIPIIPITVEEIYIMGFIVIIALLIIYIILLAVLISIWVEERP